MYVIDRFLNCYHVSPRQEEVYHVLALHLTSQVTEAVSLLYNRWGRNFHTLARRTACASRSKGLRAVQLIRLTSSTFKQPSPLFHWV